MIFRGRAGQKSKKSEKLRFREIKNHEVTGTPGRLFARFRTVSSREYGAPETIVKNHHAQLFT